MPRRNRIRFGPLLFKALVAAILLIGRAGSASAQDPRDEYSVDNYLRLQNVANHIYDRMLEQPIGSDERLAYAEDALTLRLGLIDYITGWILSGDMDRELLRSAGDTRLALYQNVVAIRVELGDCEAAEAAAMLLEEAAIESGSELAAEAQSSAWADVDSCVPAGLASTAQSTTLRVREPDDPVVLDATVAPPRHPLRGPDLTTVLGGGLVLSALYVAEIPLADTHSQIATWHAEHAGQTPDDELNELESLAHRQQTTATLLGAAGALALATSLWWHREVRRNGGAPSALVVAPTTSGFIATLLW